VLFPISKAWLGSAWCKNELNLARRLNKRLFGILIEERIAVGDLPADVTSKWQVINLAAGSAKQFPVMLPVTGELATPTFSLEGLARLKSGLRRAGLAESWFAWPPEHDRDRSPYRGLRPLEAEDAGIFFGREAPTIRSPARHDRGSTTTPARDPRRLRRWQVELPSCRAASSAEPGGSPSYFVLLAAQRTSIPTIAPIQRTVSRILPETHTSTLERVGIVFVAEPGPGLLTKPDCCS